MKIAHNTSSAKVTPFLLGQRYCCSAPQSQRPHATPGIQHTGGPMSNWTGLRRILRRYNPQNKKSTPAFCKTSSTLSLLPPRANCTTFVQDPSPTPGHQCTGEKAHTTPMPWQAIGKGQHLRSKQQIFLGNKNGKTRALKTDMHSQLGTKGTLALARRGSTASSDQRTMSAQFMGAQFVFCCWTAPL